MIGIKFTATSSDDLLCKIFDKIDVKKYSWQIIKDQEEVIKCGDTKDFFETDSYSGLEFYKCIQNKHYVIFLKTQAFFSKKKSASIRTYADFLKSECQLLLLVYDCEYIEVYAREESILRKIYENAISYNYENIECIETSSQMRKDFNIF